MGARSLLLLLLVGSLCSGCRLHLDYVLRNRSPALQSYGDIRLEEHARTEVLARLGPPDTVRYQLDTFVFDYESAQHRASRLQFFVPSEVIPGVDPLAILNVPAFFFDLAEPPESLRPATFDRVGRAAVATALNFVPFVSGQELVSLEGYQVRSDRLRIVFDRETQRVTAKSLRLATGQYREESTSDRVLLRSD